MANLILLTVYFLLKLTNFLVKSAFRQFIKYISKIMIHSKLQEPTFNMNYSRLSLSRLRLFRITGYLEEKIWSLFKHGNITSANKILWIRGEIAPQEQFLPFPTIFSIYISNSRNLITYSFVKFDCAICIFLNPENLLCRSTDISKCFRGSFELRDNES